MCIAESLSERTPVNHPYALPCVVTAVTTERYATTIPYHPMLHVSESSFQLVCDLCNV